MSLLGWNASAWPRRILVLGGIRSGKSELAEALVTAPERSPGDDAATDGPSPEDVATAADRSSEDVATGAVRYIATAAAGQDPEMAERIARHRARRPEHWRTEELGDEPQRLAALISDADHEDTLIVDDLGGWLTATLDAAGWAPSSADAPVAALVDAVHAAAARLVLVSPEVGWSVVPATDAGRAFADATGEANHALAEACDAVVLVVAGQPVWLKGGPAAVEAATSPAAGSVVAAAPAPAAPQERAPASATAQETAAASVASQETEPGQAADAFTAPTVALPLVGASVTIEPGMVLPMPDDNAATVVKSRLELLDVPGAAGLGALARAVSFVAATQTSASPRPFGQVRAYLLRCDHEGRLSAGEDTARADRRVREAQAGGAPLGSLAIDAGVPVTVVELPPASPVEAGPVMDRDRIDAAMRDGWRLADQVADEGCDAVVLASCGAGADAAATAVISAVTSTEPAALLDHVMAEPNGRGRRFDDAAWMERCVALRDALRRVDIRSRDPRTLLAMLGGPDLAVATGLLLGAAARRTPVLLDGPVGVAAALLARDFAGQVRYWCLLVDDGGHPAVKVAARALDLEPVVNLGLGLGEGTGALASLPLLRSALTLSTLAGADA